MLKTMVSPPFNVVIIGKLELVILRDPLIGVRLIVVTLGRNALVISMLPETAELVLRIVVRLGKPEVRIITRLDTVIVVILGKDPLYISNVIRLGPNVTDPYVPVCRKKLLVAVISPNTRSFLMVTDLELIFPVIVPLLDIVTLDPVMIPDMVPPKIFTLDDTFPLIVTLLLTNAVPTSVISPVTTVSLLKKTLFPLVSKLPVI